MSIFGIKKGVRFLSRKLFNYSSDIEFILTQRPRLRYLESKYQGKRCFIVGNGPSISQHDLTKLKNEFCFVTNWFILHHDYKLINPSFYCVSDPRFFNRDVVDTTWYRTMCEKTRQTIKFFPWNVKQIIRKNHLFENHIIFYLDYSAGRSWEQNKTNLDITRPLYSGDTIIIDFCLPIAFYLGFQHIYLIGCDCNLGCEAASEKSHFYDDKYHETETPGSDYHKKYWFNNINKSYSIVRKEIEKTNTRIFNAGIGGNLEVFDRVDYDSLFNKI